MIRKTYENQILNQVALSQELNPVEYKVILKSLIEASINDFDELMEKYDGWEVADALIVLDRLASLESLDDDTNAV